MDFTRKKGGGEEGTRRGRGRRGREEGEGKERGGERKVREMKERDDVM